MLIVFELIACEYGAGGGRKERRQNAQHGAFSSTVRPHERGGRPSCEAEVEAVQYHVPTVKTLHVLQFDALVCRRFPCAYECS